MVIAMPNKRTRPTPKDPRKARPGLRQSLRKRVLATYDTCAICGREVDKSLPPNHPLAPQVDEIIPVSRGGSPYDWDNLQLTHRECNIKKSNKMVGDINVTKIENPYPVSRAW